MAIRPVSVFLASSLALALVFWAGGCATSPDCGCDDGPPKIFDVRTYGATGNGHTLDTAAVQQALDECGRAGGGIVRVRAGTYLCQPLVLHSKLTLSLDRGATIKATDDPTDYLPANVTWDEVLQRTKRGPFRSFISGQNLTNVTISGHGTIDGSGARWWAPAEDARRVTPGYTLPRPNLVTLTRCRHVRLEGITLANSPKLHFGPAECEDVAVENVTVRSPETAANTDGIDPSNCHYVTIAHCTIDTGDDNIAIKAGGVAVPGHFACENIVVSDCVFLHGHGMSIGSETSGGLRGLTVVNCRFENTENGIRIKSRRGRGGIVEDLTYTNITMKNVRPAISIVPYYQDSTHDQYPTNDPPQPMVATTPVFRNIRIVNLTATAVDGAGLVVGLPESPVSDLVLENVRIKAKTGLTFANASSVALKNVQVKVERGAPILLDHANVGF
jgi:polygalacturonase